MNNQAGIHNRSKYPARMLPVEKLIQAKQARKTTIEPLQTISNVLILVIYNETAEDKMGIYP